MHVLRREGVMELMQKVCNTRSFSVATFGGTESDHAMLISITSLNLLSCAKTISSPFLHFSSNKW